MMTICSPQLGISPHAHMGGEVHDREMLKALAGLGVEVEIILPAGKKFDNIKNWRILRLPFPFIYPPAIFNLIILPYLFSIHRRTHFTILRVHSLDFVGLGAVIFRLFNPTVRLVATIHHLESPSIFDRFDSLIAEKMDKIITVSLATKMDLIQRYNLHPDKISVIVNGVENKYFPHKDEGSFIKKYPVENQKIILFLGHLIKRKNLGFILDLVKQIKSEDAVLIIAGGGPEENSLRNRTKKLGIENKVIFTGFISERDKVALYNSADIFVYPSEVEGFGLSLAEAMACACAVVAADFEAAKEIIIPGQTGYILPLRLDIWADTIIKLLHNKKLRDKIGQAASLEIKNKFSWKNSAEKYLSILNSL